MTDEQYAQAISIKEKIKCAKKHMEQISALMRNTNGFEETDTFHILWPSGDFRFPINKRAARAALMIEVSRLQNEIDRLNVEFSKL